MSLRFQRTSLGMRTTTSKASRTSPGARPRGARRWVLDAGGGARRPEGPARGAGRARGWLGRGRWRRGGCRARDDPPGGFAVGHERADVRAVRGRGAERVGVDVVEALPRDRAGDGRGAGLAALERARDERAVGGALRRNASSPVASAERRLVHVVDGHVVAPRVARACGRDRPADPRLSRAEISPKLSARSSKSFAARCRAAGGERAPRRPSHHRTASGARVRPRRVGRGVTGARDEQVGGAPVESASSRSRTTARRKSASYRFAAVFRGSAASSRLYRR